MILLLLYYGNYNEARIWKICSTEFVGGGHGAQFAPLTTVIKLQPGDFAVFPYDMLHCVYPHFNENETRRTFPTNIDVYLNKWRNLDIVVNFPSVIILQTTGVRSIIII